MIVAIDLLVMTGRREIMTNVMTGTSMVTAITTVKTMEIVMVLTIVMTGRKETMTTVMTGKYMATVMTVVTNWL